MQLFTTQPDAKAAYLACKKLEEEHRRKYIANSTESDRNSKYFYIGYDDWYESEEHLELLQQCGFNNDDEYSEALKKTDWYICYEKFNNIFKIVKDETKNALKTELFASGLWNEESGIEQGVQLYECCKKAAPKETQLADLLDELGLSWPVLFDLNS